MLVSLSLLASLLMAALAQEPDYVAGRSLYDAFEYEQALFRFQQALVKPGLTPKEQAEVSLWLALCLDGVGRQDDADRAMGDAVTLDPAATLPTSTSPAFSARFTAIAAATKAAAQSSSTSTPTTPRAPPTATVTSPATFAWVLGGGGGMAVLGAAVLGVVAAERWGASTDQTAFVDDRAAAHGVYVGTLAGAVVAGVVGTGLLVGAVLASGDGDDDGVAPAVTGSGA